ncbi:hypothetical protein VP01_1004g2 [Puccinia sorghi]|uniref:Uncharacterized protein n=1 Tax=Puccinia sorghi TaxID=27349 RepID=A0A0L6VVK5_9BASI|nr:hypothetical protein VP01_1004g2 [Puccinia sorghi]
MILFYPLHLLGIALLKIMVSNHFISCSIIPKSFPRIALVLIISLWDLVKDFMKDTGQFILATAGFCSAALRFTSLLPHFECSINFIASHSRQQIYFNYHMHNAELGNHTQISSQVQNLAKLHLLFTDQIEMLDSMGVYTMMIILYKLITVPFVTVFQKRPTGQLPKDNLVNIPLESAYTFLSENDKTSMLLYKEILFLQNGSKMEDTTVINTIFDLAQEWPGQGWRERDGSVPQQEQKQSEAWLVYVRETKKASYLIQEKIKQMKVHKTCTIGNQLGVPSRADYFQ